MDKTGFMKEVKDSQKPIDQATIMAAYKQVLNGGLEGKTVEELKRIRDEERARAEKQNLIDEIEEARRRKSLPWRPWVDPDPWFIRPPWHEHPWIYRGPYCGVI